MSQALATAEWADPETFAKKHAYETGKFWLGRSPTNGQPLGYADDRHVCLVSGSRAGKGTTTIIPNLCLWPGSVVVVDPKGENATVTAARRGPGSEHCKGMGQAVHVLDPFRVARVDDGLRSRFNPLDVLDPSDPRTIDEAGRLADAIVVINPESKDPFWDQSARSLVKGLIMHVLTDSTYEGRRNLITVRQLIARGDYEGVAILREAGETEIYPPQVLLWQGVSQSQAFNGVVAGIGENMTNMAINSAKQFESVLQVANRNTEFLDSPGMAECLTVSDFSLADLKTDPKGVSVYLSLPQRYMGEHFRWLRMMITLIVNEMEAVPGQPATGHRVLMCLDEFAGLKRMEVIENAVAQIAGFGVKLFFVLQSLEQLKATYKDNWETFLSNAGLKLFFGLDDHFSRKYVSDFIGDTELIRELATASTTTNEQITHSSGSHSSSSWNNQQSIGTNSSYSSSDSWKSMPFFLRNTAGFFAAISGKRQATRNRNTGTNEGTAKSEGGSDGTQQSTAKATGSGQTSGQNESLHKRPLVTPDEVGRYFGRIDDSDDPLYPGLGLTVLSGSNPSPVQRVNYFESPELQGLFTDHPDHPTTHLQKLSISLLSERLTDILTSEPFEVSFYEVGLVPRWVREGELIAQFELITRYHRYCDRENCDLLSPCTGQFLSFRQGQAEFKSKNQPNTSVIHQNIDAVCDFAQQKLKKDIEIRNKKDAEIPDGIWAVVLGLTFTFILGVALTAGSIYSFDRIDGIISGIMWVVFLLLGVGMVIVGPVGMIHMVYEQIRNPAKPKNKEQKRLANAVDALIDETRSIYLRG